MTLQPEEKLDHQKQKILDTDKITETELQKYLQKLRKKGAKSPETLSHHIRRLQNILTEEQLNFEELEEQDLQELTDKVWNGIEESRYNKKEAGLSRTQKIHYLTTWKRTLQTIGEDSIAAELSSSGFTETQSRDIHADPKPGDLPTPRQVKKLVQTMEQVSKSYTYQRNQALILFLWDTGARIGEALQVQIKNVEVRNRKVRVQIHGNKGNTDDRTIRILQGHQTLREYIETHPGKENPESYLFPLIGRADYQQPLKKNSVAEKIVQAKSHASLDFKTYGEPNHIFRKAMSTYYPVNDILSWSEVCERQGKSPDSTMPDYVKMAMTDLDAKAAEEMGIDDNAAERDGRMIGSPLVPKNCRECGKLSKCFRETCSSCGTELPESKMPKGDSFDKDSEELEKERLKAEIKQLLETADQLGVNLE